MYRALPGIAILSVALITGCGGPKTGDTATDKNDSASSAVKDTTTQELNDAQLKVENEIADCMKKQGFTYVPNPFIAESNDLPLMRYGGSPSYLQSDSDVRKWREKYGFGLTSALVYPNDPQVAEDSDEGKNPNAAIVDKLDPARRDAYRKALTGSTDGNGYEPKTDSKKKNAAELQANSDNSCQGKAGRADQDQVEAKEASRKKSNHQIVLKFQNDSAVVSAVKEYGNCLKERGHKVALSNPLPRNVLDGVTRDFLAPLEAAPDSINAKEELVKEVKLALDDVDCRTSYAKIVRTKYPQVVAAENTEGAG
jgi:hypothetical protein